MRWEKWVMHIDDELLELDYLVFSSHKTATQTLVRSLNASGLKCKHCHVLPNIGLERGCFLSYVEQYLDRNGKRLKVLSVFREPVARHISSFFQIYGSRPLRLKEVEHEGQTVISRCSIDELQRRFITEVSRRSMMGLEESIHEICRDLALRVDQVDFNRETGVGSLETSHLVMHVFRFDILIDRMESLLCEVTGGPVFIKSANLGDQKWYRDRYRAFKETLVLPRRLVREVYELRRDLISLMYQEKFDVMLQSAIAKYSDAEI